MIKLYTDRTLLTPENRRQVHPLLFDLYYFEYTDSSVHEHYCIVENPNDAHVFIFPIDYVAIWKKNAQSHYHALYNLAKSLNKKLLVYTGGDYGTTFNDEVIITWRNAGFKSTNDHQTIVIPSFINDPLERDDIELIIHDFNAQPQISFTGFATASKLESFRISIATIKGNLKRLLKKDKSDAQAIYNAAGKRYTYLKKLESHLAIKTDFIYRDTYRAGAVTKEQREKSTMEFFKNLNNSPYTFCLRGAGNFSVRFYESLACGRIPVLVDTDVQLPLEHVINWDKHICRILPHENVSDKFLAFHRFHKNSLQKLQQSNRALYQNYLVRHAFFCKLHDVLKEML